MAKIFWAGDSTVQTNTYEFYPQNGIGQVFSLFIKEDYTVENHAKNGRSTKSFIDEGRLKAIEEKIGEGDYLFIQFGHNDEKEKDPTRYTDPFTTFIDNLGIYINVAREHGAFPLLITPIERRCFGKDKTLGPGAHGDWVAGMKQAAEKYQVPLVDLYTMTREELARVGEEESRRWYMYYPENTYPSNPKESLDNTHLRHEGAVHYASLIAKGIRQLEDNYSKMILDELNL